MPKFAEPAYARRGQKHLPAAEYNAIVRHVLNDILAIFDTEDFHTETTGGQMTVALNRRPKTPVYTHPRPVSSLSVETVGAAAEGSEAADTESYDLETGTDVDEGVTVYALSRIGYFDAGNETLYMYVRALEFDEFGHLVSVGAETRVAVDVPVDC